MLRGFIKRVKESEHSGFWQWVFWTSIGMLFILTFIGGNNILRWFQAGITLRSQEKQKVEYQLSIEQMQDSIRLLKSNCDSLEKYARESFHFAAPGEDVYLFED